ncbi:hypothetical protein RZS08_05230, partial [Arthrospira platensis SPKY1]|nr:hypothetical protein [Arthrospira platensis SPKY1]
LDGGATDRIEADEIEDSLPIVDGAVLAIPLVVEEPGALEQELDAGLVARRRRLEHPEHVDQVCTEVGISLCPDPQGFDDAIRDLEIRAIHVEARLQELEDKSPSATKSFSRA